MAASAPPPKAADNWSDPQSGSENGKSLALNMSHASIMSSLQSNASRPPTLSGSSVSTAPDEHHRHLSLGSLSLPSADQSTLSPPLQKQQLVLPHNLPRPPGLGGTQMVSPISKSAPPVNSISSSPNFSLTSLPGDLDDDFHLKQPPSSILSSESSHHVHSSWTDMANGLSLSRNTNDSPVINGSSNGSYNSHDNDPDDGLRGLGALRERSQSSPGPAGTTGVFSSSPPIRIDVSPYQGELSPLHTDNGFELSNSRHRGLPPDPRRMRSLGHGKERNSRPPLAGVSQSAAYFGDGLDRPDDCGGRANDLTTRMRAISIGEQHIYDNRSAHNEQLRHQQHTLQNIDHTHKFANGHNLNAIHHNRAHNQLSMRNGSYGESHPVMQSALSRSISAGESMSLGQAPSMLQRSISMTAQMQHSHMDSSQLHRRASDFGAHSYTSRHVHSNLQQRREDYDDAGVPVMATPEEMRAFGIRGYEERHQRSNSFSRSNQRMPSPPGHQHVAGGGRRHSDFVTMNASPYGVGTRYSESRHGHHVAAGHNNNMSHVDDDLSHPLAGELIDDPADIQFGLSNQIPIMGSPHQYNVYGRTDVQRLSRAPVEQRVHNSYGHVDSLHHHHPTAGASIPSHRLVYNVKFKRTQRSFVLGPRVSRDLKVGCYVKVEADRGEDLGIIVGKAPNEKLSSSGRASFSREMGMTAGSSSMASSDLKRIVRLATHDEVSLLAVKREEEDELLKICRGKVRQRGLPMHVVDAEYQFDRHKLTFFFEADGRIDFRELVRDLFSMYKTRIWMQQLDKNTTTSTGPAAAPSPPSVAFSTSPGSADFGNTPYMSPQLEELSEPYGVPNELGGAHHH